jgi:Uma2 family endonuclease
MILKSQVSTGITPHPALTEMGFFRLSVADYHDMIANDIVTAEDRVELLDGYLVTKMGQNSPHSSTVDRLDEDFKRSVPVGWRVRVQLPITLSASEPEPDGVIVRGDRRTFDGRHPLAAEVALVVEVADSSLRLDREVKGPIYARAGIPTYWIVNLQDATVEVYTEPSGESETPSYARREAFAAADSIPVILDGVEVARLPVADLLP